eukprot:1155945-Pelagomonas_calceolata.AAC.4
MKGLKERLHQTCSRWTASAMHDPLASPPTLQVWAYTEQCVKRTQPTGAQDATVHTCGAVLRN